MKRVIRYLLCLLIGVMFLGLVIPAHAAEETVEIVGPWKSSGRIFLIGPDKMKFMGTLEGVMYIQGAEGAFDAAGFKCPATITLDTKKGTTEIKGNFIITGKTGDLVFADLNSAGIIGASKGTFTITGGTGKFDGISGSGDIFIRTALGTMAVGLESGAYLEALGLAMWPGLKITVPAK
jgi:hypothetical protein